MLTTRSTRRLKRIGIQVYSLREAARRDLETTLGDIAAIGYSDVELLASAKNFGIRPSRVREVLDRTGLRAPSTHVAAEALDNLETELDDAQTLGHEYLIVASLPTGGKPTLDEYRHWADRLNEAGRQARARGLWIGFHNHAHDLNPIDGVVPYDLLLERTDPALVRHQLDTGNIALAGLQPLDYMKRHGELYSLFHLKDIARSEPGGDTDLGDGIVDFRQLLANIDDIDSKLLFVEQETSSNALKSASRAYSYITALDF